MRLVVFVAGGVAIYRVLPNDVAPAELARVQPGMTEQKVLAILGEPNQISRFEGYVDWQYSYDWGWRAIVRFKDKRVVAAIKRVL